MNVKTALLYSLIASLLIAINCTSLQAQTAPIVPPAQQLNRPFGAYDKAAFQSPSKVYYPETWFHFIGGNVSKKGITKDLEAIAGSGISGIQLFHGQFGGPWPGVDTQIACLSPLWEDAILHTAEECKRLQLKFTMQNCPGWAMAGGPWITPANAMRNLVWSRTDVQSTNDELHIKLEKPQPSKEPWRDYKEVTVLAFPTPAGDSGKTLSIQSVTGSDTIHWNDVIGKKSNTPLKLPPTQNKPYSITINFPDTATIRTLELPPVSTLCYPWCYQPDIHIRVQAILQNGDTKEILNTGIPASNFQDHMPLSFALSETVGVKACNVFIDNKHDIELSYLNFYSAARKNNWESEAAWTLRNINRDDENYNQSTASYINPTQIQDITSHMDTSGNLVWNAPPGNWTILRIGHVNSGKKNGPAPPEGTGWECNKLSATGADAHFAGYIGRLSGDGGILHNSLLTGMLMDSWECETQTWTDNMENDFQKSSGYPLRKWLPALFGYVLEDQETTFKFLHDWRYTINDLVTNQFYGRMATLAKNNNLNISYETSAGDVFPADILEYYKFADVPMCEFWQPLTAGFVGSLNFKPIKPAASAAHLYGKPRLGSEAFTSFDLTWDEHWQDLKEVANVNMVEGVTHLIYHTYTHNPRADSLIPGTSFGAQIGTPFLRGQTWWKYMPRFNEYFARCSYLLERGKPVSDVLWYLGDEIDHKPDQNAPFPDGFKYDYCNPDILLHRLTVKNGMLQTPEGIQYKVLWLPTTTHMLPQTLEKLDSLIQAGATIIGNEPQNMVTLSGGEQAQNHFNQLVKNIWGAEKKTGIKQSGKGKVIAGLSLSEALQQLHIEPDVKSSEALWIHRRVAGADWYFISSTKGKSFSGTLDIRNTGSVELWDPVSGKTEAVSYQQKGERTLVSLDLPVAGSCFLVFNHDGKQNNNSQFARVESASVITLKNPWTLSFPAGWGATKSIQVNELKPWKDLDISPEAKAFSGTVTYTTMFAAPGFTKTQHYTLNLGDVNMIAKVTLNGKVIDTVWCNPYVVDLTKAMVQGNNTLQVEVTGTWFNRLVYDANLPEAQRKTWTIAGPPKDSALRNSGLLGPVSIWVKND